MVGWSTYMYQVPQATGINEYSTGIVITKKAVAHTQFVKDGISESLKKRERPGRPLQLTGLREEGVEGVVAASDGLVGGHLPIGLDAMLKAVKLPTGVTYDTSRE